MIRRIALVAACALGAAAVGCSQTKTASFDDTHSVKSVERARMVSSRVNAPAETYRYYPDDRVYYSEDRGVYFWRNRQGAWEHGVRTIADVPVEDIMAFVRVKLHVDDPTVFHGSFARAFPGKRGRFAHSQPRAIATVTGAWPE